MGKDVCQAVVEIFRSGKLLKQLNATFVSLIPKVTNPTRVKDLRPISLCNTVLKITTKILADKIKGSINGVVCDSQGAFIPGRSISHKNAVAIELVRGYGKKGVSPRCAIKVDLQKAYDSVRWEFIGYMLKYFQFPEKLIGIIMECVVTPSYSILINGSPEGFFRGGRGLRQGDPLSPYLFVLCMELLSRLLKEAAERPTFRYHPKCKAMKLTHLAFADDLMIFCKADLTTIELIKGCLERFMLASGLKANRDKSSVYVAGVSQRMKDDIADAIGFPLNELPVRYLGIPLQSRRIVVAEFEPLLKRIRTSIQGWAIRKLSYAGRMQLIKAVIEGILSFWSQVFLLPVGVIEKIESMCRRFLWSGNETGNRYLVAWTEVTLPYDEGGIGIKEILAWNKGVFSKLIGDIHYNRESVWTRWARHNLTHGASIWDVQAKEKDSWAWKCALQVRDEIKLALYPNTQNVANVDVSSLARTGGGFDCCAVYELVRRKSTEVRWGDFIWKRAQCKKWSFIAWLASKNRLQTRHRIFRRGGCDSPLCELCKNDDETADHLWFQCSYVIVVCDIVLNWIGIRQRKSTIDEWLTWFADEKIGKRDNAIFQGKLMAIHAIVYFTWNARNRAIFSDEHCSPESCAKRIIQACKFRIEWKCKCKTAVEKRWRNSVIA